jgi:chromosomal replication initiator protein
VTVETIQAEVCRHYNVDLRALRGPWRHRRVAIPRAVGMYMARELTGMSFPRIGAWFGGRDHTTVMKACAKVRRWLAGEGDQIVVEDLAQIRARLAAAEATAVAA